MQQQTTGGNGDIISFIHTQKRKQASEIPREEMERAIEPLLKKSREVQRMTAKPPVSEELEQRRLESHRENLLQQMAQEWIEGNESLNFRAQAGAYSQSQMNMEQSMLVNSLLERHKERAGKIGLMITVNEVLDGTLETKAERYLYSYCLAI